MLSIKMKSLSFSTGTGTYISLQIPAHLLPRAFFIIIKALVYQNVQTLLYQILSHISQWNCTALTLFSMASDPTYFVWGVRNFRWKPKILGKCIVVKIDEICRWYKRCHISEMSPQVEKVDSSTNVKTTAVRKELTLTRIGEHMHCQCLEMVINKITLKAGTPISSFLVNLLKKWIK